VQHEWDADFCADLPRAPDVQLRGLFVKAVDRADGDGQCVYTCFRDERLGLCGGGQLDRAVAEGNVPDFGFQRDPCVMRDTRGLGAERDVLCEGELGAVDHDRGVADRDRRAELLQRFPVIQMQGDGDVGL